MNTVQKYRWLVIFLHLTFVCLFICTPYLTYVVQRIKPGVDGPNMLTVDMSSVFVQKGYLRWVLQNIIIVILFYSVFLGTAPILVGKKKNYIAYVLSCVFLIVLFIWFIHLLHNSIDLSIGHHPMRFLVRFINSFLYCFAAVLVGTLLYLALQFNHLEQQHKDAKEKQLESELLFLRSQINPHFLFNSLNNIYSLTVLGSKNAPGALLKLSDMLRFVLYESGEQFIPLNKELKYLDDYIALQSMRLNENVVVNYKVNGNIGPESIHPMLLVPFIENAFKHGISYTEKCHINILITLVGKTLILEVENSIFKAKSNELEKESGIGIKNVLRRLDILYPEKFVFTRNADKGTYKVELKLDLS